MRLKNFPSIFGAAALLVFMMPEASAAPVIGEGRVSPSSIIMQDLHSLRLGWHLKLCGSPSVRSSPDTIQSPEKQEIRSSNGSFQCLATLTILPKPVISLQMKENILRNFPAQAVAMMGSAMKGTKLEMVTVDAERGETNMRITTIDPLVGEVVVDFRLMVQGKRVAMITVSRPKNEDRRIETREVLQSFVLDPTAPVDAEIDSTKYEKGLI